MTGLEVNLARKVLSELESIAHKAVGSIAHEAMGEGGTGTHYSAAALGVGALVPAKSAGATSEAGTLCPALLAAEFDKLPPIWLPIAAGKQPADPRAASGKH